MTDTATRLLKRAIIAARSRTPIDVGRLKANYTEEMAAEDLALADSALAHRTELLAQEDRE